MASSPKPMVIFSSLVLRLLALFSLGASIVLLATDRVIFCDGSKRTFKNVIAYRYVIATGAIGFVYTLLQIPFAIYHVCTEKRLIRNKCMPEFDFYCDKIIALILATGVGAGFAITLELKKLLHSHELLRSLTGLDDKGLDEIKSKGDHFFDRAYIASGLLFGALLCTVILSILSSINRTNSSKSFFG